MSEIISSVWYLPSENTWKEFNLLAMRDTGTITLNHNELIFKGGKTKEIIINKVESISYEKQGRDFVNNWVKVEWINNTGEMETAFFADGGLLGWSGLFGGIKSLLNKIKAAFNK